MSKSTNDPAYSMLAEAHLALLDIQGLCQLLRDEQTIDQVDFPHPVAAAIRSIHLRADATLLVIEGEPQA